MPALIGRSNEIGGGFVRLRIETFGPDGQKVVMMPGTRLTAEQINGMANGRRLINTEHIAVYPPPPEAPPGERHIVNLGFGKFDVIEGRKMNERPLTKDEAEALATRLD